MPIALKFKLSFTDYLDAQRLHARTNWWLRLNYFTARFVLPVLGVCAFIFGSLNLSYRGPTVLSIVNLGLGVFLTLYPWYYRSRLKRCYRRTRIDDGETSVELDDDAIRVKGADASSDVTWNGVKFFREDQKVFMLYLAPAKFIVLPKRSLTLEQAGELHDLLTRRVHPIS